MEKLELKHIVGYLPYELKYKDKSEGFDEVRKLCVNTIGWFLFEGKPILRPISDITKEIEINGKKFVPIIEIIKKVSLIDLSDCYFDVFFEDNQYSVNAETSDRNRVIDCIYFDGNVFSAINNGGNFDALNPQLEAYEMLDQYHFDWKYDLIGKGKAIDINTL